jgi:Mg2+ and Co2+ transporter CorA
MEQENVKEVKERIALALENIEKLDKEALSFAAGKAELIKTSGEFRILLEKLTLLANDVNMLVDNVSSVTVEETLKKFDDNVSKIEQNIRSLDDSNIKMSESINLEIGELNRKSNRNFIVFGSITLILLITSIVVSILL